VPILGARGIAGPAEDGRSPFVVFSRRVAVRGVDYGEFSVYIFSPEYSPSSTILTLETAAQLIGSLAERVRLLERREELAAELEETAKLWSARNSCRGGRNRRCYQEDRPGGG